MVMLEAQQHVNEQLQGLMNRLALAGLLVAVLAVALVALQGAG